MPEPREILTTPLRCAVFVPPGRPPASGWPLLCFLHGNGEAAPMPLDEAWRKHGPLRPGNPAIAAERFLIVVPQLAAEHKGDSWHRFRAGVEAIVARECDAARADRDRTYLGGFSYGGNGVFDLARSGGDGAGWPWAAFWSVDPTRTPESALPAPSWLGLGPFAAPNEKAFERVLAPSWLPGGAEPPPEAVHLGSDLRDRSHSESSYEAFADERVYRWLLTKRVRR